MLAELLAHVLARAVLDRVSPRPRLHLPAAARRGVDLSEVQDDAGLPPPMIPGNAAAPTTLCAIDESFECVQRGGAACSAGLRLLSRRQPADGSARLPYVPWPLQGRGCRALKGLAVQAAAAGGQELGGAEVGLGGQPARSACLSSARACLAGTMWRALAAAHHLCTHAWPCAAWPTVPLPSLDVCPTHPLPSRLAHTRSLPAPILHPPSSPLQASGWSWSLTAPVALRTWAAATRRRRRWAPGRRSRLAACSPQRGWWLPSHHCRPAALRRALAQSPALAPSTIPHPNTRNPCLPGVPVVPQVVPQYGYRTAAVRGRLRVRAPGPGRHLGAGGVAAADPAVRGERLCVSSQHVGARYKLVYTTARVGGILTCQQSIHPSKPPAPLPAGVPGPTLPAARDGVRGAGRSASAGAQGVAARHHGQPL